MLDILERLQEAQLETLYIKLDNNFGRFRGAFNALNVTELVELRINPCRGMSTIHLASILKVVERCTRMEKLTLYFSSINREAEVVESLGKLANLEQLVVGGKMPLTYNDWLRVYQSNIFLIKIDYFDMLSEQDIRLIVHLFKSRYYHYLRLNQGLNALEKEGILDEVRTESVQNMLDYMRLSFV